MGLLARRRFLVCNWSIAKELRFLQYALTPKNYRKKGTEKSENIRPRLTRLVPRKEVTPCTFGWHGPGRAGHGRTLCCVWTGRGENGPWKEGLQEEKRRKKSLNLFLASWLHACGAVLRTCDTPTTHHTPHALALSPNLCA